MILVSFSLFSILVNYSEIGDYAEDGVPGEA